MRQVWFGIEFDTNPTLHEVAHRDEELLFNRTAEEDQIFALQPGDPLDSHPRAHTINPYLGCPRLMLKKLVRDPRLTRQDQVLVQEALTAQETW